MFAPSFGVAEDPGISLFPSHPFIIPNPLITDPVCGSAHCLLAPYWAQKHLDSSTAPMPETLMKGLQVSPHEGTVFVSRYKNEGTVNVGGEVGILARGEVFV
jgi:predicted PhzF superfamily epimerase YddE/YHI9